MECCDDRTNNRVDDRREGHEGITVRRYVNCDNRTDNRVNDRRDGHEGMAARRSVN